MKKTKQAPRSKTLPILLLFFGLLSLILLFAVLSNGRLLKTTLDFQAKDNTGADTLVEQSTNQFSGITNNTLPPQVERALVSPPVSLNPPKTHTPETPIPYLWQCFGEQSLCVIPRNDKIYGALKQNDGGDVRVYVGGVWVEPKTVSFQLNQKTYSEEILSDATGKTLLSTSKEYNAKTGGLILRIGMNPNYYGLISPKERQTLYLEQLVRTLTALFGNSPNDFITIQSTVLLLHSWQPSTK